jgi:hypothetical protein
MTKIKPVLPLVLMFFIIQGILLFTRDILQSKGVDVDIVNYANILFFVISLISFSLHQSAMNSGNTQAFLRNVYMALLIKMGIGILVVLLYAYFSPAINKPGLLLSMVLYLLYSFSEVSLIKKPSSVKGHDKK